ncbi:hypothetical protein ACUNGV_23465 [Serratia sp. IR-2025]
MVTLNVYVANEISNTVKYEFFIALHEKWVAYVFMHVIISATSNRNSTRIPEANTVGEKLNIAIDAQPINNDRKGRNESLFLIAMDKRT